MEVPKPGSMHVWDTQLVYLAYEEFIAGLGRGDRTLLPKNISWNSYVPTSLLLPASFKPLQNLIFNVACSIDNSKRNLSSSIGELK